MHTRNYLDNHFIPIWLLQRWLGPSGKLIAYSKPYGDKLVMRGYSPSEVGKRKDLYTFGVQEPETANWLEVGFLQRLDSQSAIATVDVLKHGIEGASEVT